MKREKLACNCKRVSYGMIEDAVMNGVNSYKEAQELLKCGTGCGRCREFTEFMVNDLISEREQKK